MQLRRQVNLFSLKGVEIKPEKIVLQYHILINYKINITKTLTIAKTFYKFRTMQYSSQKKFLKLTM